MQKSGLWIFLVSCLLLTACNKKSETSNPTGSEGDGMVKIINYSGWKNAIEISNASTRVVVVPAIGRIMYFGFKGGENLLWNNPEFRAVTLPEGQPYRANGNITWANFGGDKVWPTEQDDFPKINGYGWPPDHWFDGQAHTYELHDDGVTITGAVSVFCGARSIREIRLAEEGSRLTINQTIEKVQAAGNVSVEPVKYTIWNVTQIINPEQALFNLNPASHLDKGYYLWSGTEARNFKVYGNVGVFTPDLLGNSQKAGADSDDWLAGIVGQTVFGEFFKLLPGADYPDDGLSAEVYTSADYTEIELLSPHTVLGVGETLTHTIHWDLFTLPDEAIAPNQRRDKAVEWLNAWWSGQ